MIKEIKPISRIHYSLTPYILPVFCKAENTGFFIFTFTCLEMMHMLSNHHVLFAGKCRVKQMLYFWEQFFILL